MTSEFVLLGCVVAAFFCITSSAALLRLGKIIDEFPVHGEEKRTQSLSSPVQSIRLSIGIAGVLFLVGTGLILQEGRIAFITGTVTLVATVLFLFTALAFSFAVIHTLKHKTAKMSEAADMADLEAALIRVARTTGISPQELLNRQQQRIRGVVTASGDRGIEK